MTIQNNLPAYAGLFSNLDFKQGDESRTVYSPAAYLVDLMQLLDDEFDATSIDFNDRRGDVKHIGLDEENTHTPDKVMTIYPRTSLIASLTCLASKSIISILLLVRYSPTPPRNTKTPLTTTTVKSFITPIYFQMKTMIIANACAIP
jgi:hypothetical protein